MSDQNSDPGTLRLSGVAASRPARGNVVRFLRRLAAMGGYVLRDAAAGARRTPALTLSTVVTIVLGMTLATASVLARDAVDTHSRRWADGVEFVVYLDPGASNVGIARVRASLENNPMVRRVTFVSQEQALREFRRLYAAEKAMVDAVTPELLPSSFRVAPMSKDPETVERLATPLRADPAVYQVVTAADAISDLRDLTTTAQNVTSLVAAALGVIAVAMCAAMIRAAISARLDELQIMRLVGASRSYTVAPLIAQTALAATVAAAIAVAVSVAGLNMAATSSSRVVAAVFPNGPETSVAPVMMTAGTSIVAVTAVSVVVAISSLRGMAK